MNHSQKLLQSTMELLQIATAFLLQSATRFITNCNRYYKVRWIDYKLRQVLQNAMIITNCDSTTVLVRKFHNAPDRGMGGSCVVIPGRAPA